LTSYRHTQVGWKLLAGTLVGLALAAWLTATLSPATRAAAPWLVYALFATLGGALLLFATLTVEVDDAQIRIKFGVGVVRKRSTWPRWSAANICRPGSGGDGVCIGRRPGGYTMSVGAMPSGSPLSGNVP